MRATVKRSHIVFGMPRSSDKYRISTLYNGPPGFFNVRVMEHGGHASHTVPTSPLETVFALSLAIFAALLALNELGAQKYGQEELRLSNEKTGAYLWYQSKGLKESVAEGQ